MMDEKRRAGDGHPRTLPLTEAPAWSLPLRTLPGRLRESLSRTLTPWSGPSRVLTPEDLGYTGQGMATGFLQAAMDSLSSAGGGILRLAGGDYVSGTLVFRSGVCLEVAEGSRLIGSGRLEDYPEMHARRLTVQDTSMGMHQSLLFAEGCSRIAVCGGGEITLMGTPQRFPGSETAQATPGRPFLMRVIDCTDIHIHDIVLRDSACWMQNFLNCERILYERVRVRNQANYNNDGMDIDSCRQVWVRDCDILSGDDGICLKGAGERECSQVLVERCSVYSACNAFKIGTDTQGDFRDIAVTDCRIGGVEEDPSGLKHPWADSAVSLEMMDGGTLERVCLSNLEIRRVWTPFFMRLEDRGRVRPGEPAPGPGRLRDILICGVSGEDLGPRGSYFLGCPDRAMERILLQDIRLSQRAYTGKPTADADFGRMRERYPDAHMIDDIGPCPAYGLWARHVHGLCLLGYSVCPGEGEVRPRLVCGRDTDITEG